MRNVHDKTRMVPHVYVAPPHAPPNGHICNISDLDWKYHVGTQVAAVWLELHCEDFKSHPVLTMAFHTEYKLHLFIYLYLFIWFTLCSSF